MTYTYNPKYWKQSEDVVGEYAPTHIFLEDERFELVKNQPGQCKSWHIDQALESLLRKVERLEAEIEAWQEWAGALSPEKASKAEALRIVGEHKLAKELLEG